MILGVMGLIAVLNIPLILIKDYINKHKHIRG